MKLLLLFVVIIYVHTNTVDCADSTQTWITLKSVKKVECRPDDCQPLESSDQNGYRFSSVPDDVRKMGAKRVSRGHTCETAVCGEHCNKHYVTFTSDVHDIALNLIRCRTDDFRTFWVRKNDETLPNFSVYYEKTTTDADYENYLKRQRASEEGSSYNLD